MKLSKTLEAVLSPKGRVWLILGIGLCGMLLILFSRDPLPEEARTEEPAQSAEIVAEEYARRLEEKLTSMMAEIEGVGDVRVMVTLQNTGGYVYAQEEKRSADKQTEPVAPGTGGKVSEKENTELKYVLVENDTGRKQALVETRLEPEIRGVVIICEGADSVYVRSRVTNVITTAFRIPSTRVCVEKIREAPD